MSNLPVDPYDRTVIVETKVDNPDRAPLAGTGRDIVVSLWPEDKPGRTMAFLAADGSWVPFTTTEFSAWGGIIGNIEDQADLMAMFALYAPIADLSTVAFTGQYNDLLNKPVFGDLAFINTNGLTSYFLRGDGQWAIPVDVFATWGNITGNINAQTDLIALLGTKAPLSSPVFTGNPQAPKPPLNDNSTSVATTSWFFGQAFNGLPVMDGVAASGDSTLWARGNHRHPTDTTRAPLDSPVFTGLPLAPTPPAGNATTRLATTEFVTGAIAGAGLTPPPSDGNIYGMVNGAWTLLDLSSRWDKGNGTFIGAMDFEQPNGSQVFFDGGTGKSVWTPSTAGVVCQTATVLAGTASLTLPATSDFLRAPYSAANGIPATGDWNLSWRCQCASWTAGATAKYMVSAQGTAATGADTAIAIVVQSTGPVSVVVSNGTTRSSLFNSGAILMPDAVPVDILLTYRGTTLSLFINGVAAGSGTFAGPFNVPAGRQWRIGKPEFAAATGANMIFDSFRLQRLP